MKYLCLIYDEEKKMAGMSKSEGDAFMGEYGAYHRVGQGERPLPGRQPAPAGPHRDHDPQPQRQGVDDRRSVRRDQGTARRLLPDRSQGSQRGHPGRVADPVGQDRQHRGPADHGVQPSSRPESQLGSEDAVEQVRAAVDAVYRTESRRVLATLIRLLGDFDLAEEAMHDAFTAAVEQWPRDGIPANPRAWLVSTGRFKIDHRDAQARAVRRLARRDRRAARGRRARDRRTRRGERGRRPAAADLHLLPSRR